MLIIKNIAKKIRGRNDFLEPQQQVLENLQVIEPQIEQEPNPAMMPEAFITLLSVDHKPVNVFPTPTSSSTNDYYINWCGTTINNEIMKEEPNLDVTPLKKLLMKKFKWVLDVTDVLKSTKSRPLEVHITVSPTHHTELMSPPIEKIVRDKLYEELIPIVTCMYEKDNKQPPHIIFSPSHSETILEHFS